MAKNGDHSIGEVVADQRVPDVIADDLRMIEERIGSGTETAKVVVGYVATLFAREHTRDLHGRIEGTGGLFNTKVSNYETRFQPDYANVQTICEALKLGGHRIVLTSGTFDIIHIGHARYLEAASQFGDFLVVGVDSDDKVRRTKGSNRPIVHEEERLRMLSHIRGVDLITLKEASDPRWHLIKTVRPDVLIATEGTYKPEEISELEDIAVGKVVVLPPQATTSTTARLRKVQIDYGYENGVRLLAALREIEGMPEELFDAIENLLGTIFDASLNPKT